MIAWYHCTPPSIVKTFGEKNGVPSGSGKEIVFTEEENEEGRNDDGRTDCRAPIWRQVGTD